MMNRKTNNNNKSHKVARSNCPYCGKVMEGGNLSDSGYKMKWKKSVENQEERSFINRLLHSDVQLLGSEGYGSHITGFRCLNCKKLILSYE